MGNKVTEVYVIGAGFSAPAKIPIQNRILKEITTTNYNEDFLTFTPENESIKFMMSFVKIGLYLLENYTQKNCNELQKYFSKLKNMHIIHSNNDIISKNNMYRELQQLKEKIRQELEQADLQISLEDIFTSFDKSYQSKEYLYEYSYYEATEIKESIMRLFVYYFCKCINNHDFKSQEYINFCNYIRNNPNITLISTNWDFLIEEYFNRQKIKYNLCLNDPYFVPNNNKNKKNEVKLIKLHGSINWFKCLNCGTLNIIDNSKCGNFLFEDNIPEHCSQCGYNVQDGLLLQSEIITPTMIKSINSQLYNNLWYTAKRELMCAKSVTFIGYSLPIADFELRYLLQRSIPNGIPIDVVLHSTDNPCNTSLIHLKNLLPEKRYNDLFIKNPKTFYYNGFDDYFINKIENNRSVSKIN